MKKKIRVSENELVELIEKILTEEPHPDMETFGMRMFDKSEEEKSKARKLDYFTNIFLPRFQEIKEIHGLDFTIELLNNLSFLVDEVSED